MHHYVYLIWNEYTHRYYIGVRSSECAPEEDDYWGSSKFFDDERRATPEGWIRFILATYDTRALAVDAEHEHLKGHVGNGLCINRCAGGQTWKRVSRKGSKMALASRLRIGEANRSGKNPLYRQRLAHATSKTWQDPVIYAKRSEGIKASTKRRAPDHYTKGLAKRHPMQYALTVAVRSAIPFTRLPEDYWKSQ